MVLVGGLEIPPDGFRVVCGHANALGVILGKRELGVGVVLVGGLAEPLNSFGVALRNVLAKHVPPT